VLAQWGRAISAAIGRHVANRLPAEAFLGRLAAEAPRERPDGDNQSVMYALPSLNKGEIKGQFVIRCYLGLKSLSTTSITVSFFSVSCFKAFSMAGLICPGSLTR